MISDSLARIETRIAEIQSRIDELTGIPQGTAGATPTQSAFAARLSGALAMGQGQTGPTRWDALVQEAATEYGVDAGLVKAVLMSESGGNPGATSSAGAMGLMQLMPGTARSLGVEDPYDPRQNVFGGARYLRGLIDRLGSPELAVAAYNAGPGAVAKYNGIPPYPETQHYVSTVMAKWRGGMR